MTAAALPLGGEARRDPMHILLVHQLFLRAEDAGMSQHYDFAHHLVRSGHRVTVLAGRRSYLTGTAVSTTRRQVLEPGLEVIPCAQVGGVHRSFVWRTVGFLSFMLSSLVAGLRVPQVDVVWTTSPPLPQVCTAWFVAWVRRRPWVFEIRDLWPAVAVEMGILRNRLLIAIAGAVEGFLYRWATKIVVNSPGFLPYLCGRSIPSARIEVVPNGVDPSAFAPEDRGESFRRAHGLQDRFVVLYAGAHGQANDLMTLLAAAERMQDEPRVAFVLVGDGKQKPSLMAAAAQKRLDNVLFLAAVPRVQIAGVVAAADVGVATLKPIPLFATVYPNKVFDYMAAGRPVVLAMDGAIRALVEEAGAGLVVRPGDAAALSVAVRSLLRDPVAARRMGARGRACVEAGFDRRLSAEKLERLLQAAVRS